MVRLFPFLSPPQRFALLHTSNIRTSYFPPPAALILYILYTVYNWFPTDNSHMTQWAASHATLWMPDEPQLLCQAQAACRPQKSLPRGKKKKPNTTTNFPNSLYLYLVSILLFIIHQLFFSPSYSKKSLEKTFPSAINPVHLDSEADKANIDLKNYRES